MTTSTRPPARLSGLGTIPSVVGLSLLGLSGLCAQAAELGLPNAGSILQELKPQPDAALPKGDIILRTQPAPGAGLPLTAPFDIKLIRITGNTRFDTPTLHALVKPVEGLRLTLDQLDAAIGVITEHYRRAGYRSGVLSGDSGAFGSLELRYALPLPKDWQQTGNWQVSAFVDSGTLHTNKNPWSSGSNEASLSGAGLGLTWQGPGQWRARITYARSLGNTPAQLAGSAARHQSAWVEVGTGF